ncbi:hypothetical protein ACOI1H_10175, partial [Loktanella sp. DJP18]|uniref:hypothetical protein n=1 Tax=Loktanella sp. DJP18 TaxID=3409788 RepID=UPI003BB7C846
LGRSHVGIAKRLHKQFGSRQLSDLTGLDFIRWVNGHDIANASKRGLIAVINASMAYARDQLTMPNVPDIKIKKPNAEDTPTRFCTADQRDDILTAISHEARDELIFLFFSGARPVEMNRLMWSDVRVEMGEVYVTLQLQRRQQDEERAQDAVASRCPRHDPATLRRGQCAQTQALRSGRPGVL